MVLVSLCVVVLSSTGLAPVGFSAFERLLDARVEQGVPGACERVEFDGEDAWLDAQLEDSPAGVVWWAEGAFGTLVPSGCASGDVPEFGPWEVVCLHGCADCEEGGMKCQCRSRSQSQ